MYKAGLFYSDFTNYRCIWKHKFDYKRVWKEPVWNPALKQSLTVQRSSLPPPASTQSLRVRCDLPQVGHSELYLVLVHVLDERGGQRSNTKNKERSLILPLRYFSSLWVHLAPKFSHSLSFLLFHSLMFQSDITLPPLHPFHTPPPCLCGTGCFTRAVLTLTAPSLWRLISCSDTLSLYHANGPAHPPACVYAISTLSKTPENWKRQIRETYTHIHLSCRAYVGVNNRKVGEGDYVCIWNKRSGGWARERGIKTSTTNVVSQIISEREKEPVSVEMSAISWHKHTHAIAQGDLCFTLVMYLSCCSDFPLTESRTPVSSDTTTGSWTINASDGADTTPTGRWSKKSRHAWTSNTIACMGAHMCTYCTWWLVGKCSECTWLRLHGEVRLNSFL